MKNGLSWQRRRLSTISTSYTKLNTGGVTPGTACLSWDTQHLTFCDSKRLGTRRHLSRGGGCGRLDTGAEERTKEGIYQHSGLFRAPLNPSWDDGEESLSPPQRRFHSGINLKMPLCCLNTFPCGTCVPLPHAPLLMLGLIHQFQKVEEIFFFIGCGFFGGCQLTSHPIW